MQSKAPLVRQDAALARVLVSITVISGGFVAGLKAGKIYNTFPMMGDHWFPPGLMALEPAWRNFFDNMTTVQFDHRYLAITTFVLVVFFWFKARNADLPARAKAAVNALLHTAILQVALGITTLLHGSPCDSGRNPPGRGDASVYGRLVPCACIKESLMQVCFDQDLIVRYGGRGPRYTSYPTALQFNDELTEADYEAKAKESNDSDVPLSLYVHIPFCHSLCYYCGCNKIVTRNEERVSRYMEMLYKEIEMQSNCSTASARSNSCISAAAHRLTSTRNNSAHSWTTCVHRSRLMKATRMNFRSRSTHARSMQSAFANLRARFQSPESRHPGFR